MFPEALVDSLLRCASGFGISEEAGPFSGANVERLGPRMLAGALFEADEAADEAADEPQGVQFVTGVDLVFGRNLHQLEGDALQRHAHDLHLGLIKIDGECRNYVVFGCEESK